MIQTSDKSSSLDEPTRKSTTRQALYRGYRPKNFDEVVGQDHITTTLKNAISSGRISHAYLFTGPHGVGKTSVARILAHELNGVDYTDESIHLDIIEIDAASNRRIDEIRDLRDKVHISPTSGKYKVYIIDEVHMLTREAFNALLKTLEEPPAHVIFILATTEAHKLPETIVSRTQRFEFKPIANQSATGHLAHIAKSEKIKISPAALELLAEHGEGSFRDSIGLLDQLSATADDISEELVRQFLGLPPTAALNNLLSAITSGSIADVLQGLDQLRLGGANPARIARLLAKQVRTQLINGAAQAWMNNLLRQLIEVPGSANPEDSLEIAVLEASAAAGDSSPTHAAAANAPAVVTEPTPAPNQAKAEPEVKAEPEEPQAKPTPAPKKAAKPTNLDEEAWEQIVSKVKDQAASIYTALRLATPEAKDGKLILAFQFPLHQKKLDQAEHKALIGQIVAEVTGQDLMVEPVVSKAKPKAPKIKEAVKSKQADESLATISNIFGSPEVLES